MDGPEGNPMQSSTISRNYAETLLILARKANDPTGWGQLLGQLADAIQKDKTLKLFMESPRVAVSVKKDVIAKALSDKTPAIFVRFLQQLVVNRRQAMIGEISAEYNSMLNAAENRLVARITVSRPPAADELSNIVRQLETNLGHSIDAKVVIDPSILGGVVVRIGDTVMDGSILRKLSLLRRRMVARPSYSNA